MEKYIDGFETFIYEIKRTTKSNNILVQEFNFE